MSGILGVAVQGVERSQRRMDAMARQADRMIWDEVEAGAKLVEISARRRAIVARNTNVQDDTTRRDLMRRTPVRVKKVKSAQTCLVVVTSFWTNARSKAIRGLYAKYGLTEKLSRRNLWVQKVRRRTKTGRRSHAGHQTRSGLTKMPLQGRLLAWARGEVRGNVGDQHLASVVRTPVEVRLDLVLGPAARQHSDTIRDRIQSAVERAGRVRG